MKLARQVVFVEALVNIMLALTVIFVKMTINIHVPKAHICQLQQVKLIQLNVWPVLQDMHVKLQTYLQHVHLDSIV